MKGEDGKEKTFVGPALTEVVGAPLLVGIRRDSWRLFPVSLLPVHAARDTFFFAEQDGLYLKWRIAGVLFWQTRAVEYPFA